MGCTTPGELPRGLGRGLVDVLVVTGLRAPQGAFLRVTGSEAFTSKLPLKDPHQNQSGYLYWPETEVHLTLTQLDKGICWLWN